MMAAWDVPVGGTSKIHALFGAESWPVTLHLTEGEVPDCIEAEVLIEKLGEGDILLADRGYDTNPSAPRRPREKPGPTFR